MIKRPVKIEVAQNSSKRNVLNSSVLSNQDFNSMSFSTRSNQNYSQSSGTIDASTELTGSEIQGTVIPSTSIGNGSLDINNLSNLNIDVSLDANLDLDNVSSRFQERVGFYFEDIEESIQEIETEIREKFSGDCFFVNFDIFEDDQTTNLNKVDNINIGDVLTSNNAYVPDNIFDFYINFTNKNINDIQHLSYINPKIKLVNENNFNDIKNINLDIVNNFYSKLSFKASKIFSKIPNIVTFIDQKLNNTYNTIVDFNDKISISIQKLNDFYLKYNYANKIEEFLINDNKNKNFIGQIYINSQFDEGNISFYNVRQNDNLQTLQTNEVNISDLVSSNENNYNSLLTSNFSNINNDILDTDSFIAQQIINLSCSFFTFYPTFYSRNNVTSRNSLKTQKLNTKYSKVCINTSNVYNKNVFSYINENNNNIKKDLVEDTKRICIPVNTSFNQNGITKNINFDTDFVDNGDFNINTEISRIEAFNIVEVGDSSSGQNYYRRSVLRTLIKFNVSNDISELNQYVRESDQINQKMSFYVLNQAFQNLLDESLGQENKPILSEVGLSYLKSLSLSLDPDFRRTITENENRLYFNNLSDAEFDLFNYLFFSNAINSFKEQKFDSENGLDNLNFKLLQDYLSYIIEEKHGEISHEYIISNNWNKEFSLNNYFFELNDQENYSIRQKTNEIIKIFRNAFLNIPSNSSIIPTNINFGTSSIFARLFIYEDTIYEDSIQWIMSFIKSGANFVDVSWDNISRRTINLRNTSYLDVNKLFMSIDFCKFFIYFVSIKLRESFISYINSVKSLLRYIASSSELEASFNNKSLYEILDDNSFYLTGIITTDFVHKRKNSLVIKNLWGNITNISQQPNNTKYDYLSKENLVLNSSKSFIDCDALIKRFKLDLLDKNNVDLSIFRDTIKSIKNKNNQKYLASFSNESNSNVFAYKDDIVFKKIFKNNNESSYSYFNFFNNVIQKDMNIYNTSFFINESLENDVYNDNLNIVQDIAKNYYPKNVFYNTTTFMKSVYENINKYFDQNLSKNDLILQYLYFCCFEDNINTNSQSKPINKDKIIDRFFRKALSLRDEVSNSNLRNSSVGYSFDQTDVNRDDFDNDEDFYKEVLNTNEDYKKLISSVFSFNKNVAKSIEIFKIYNLRNNMNLSFRIIDDDISIPLTEESNVDFNTTRNNIVDVEYYTFPFKRFNRDFLLTYFEDRSFKESINIVKRFNIKIDDELPALSISEEYKQLCDFIGDSDGNNRIINIAYKQRANIIKSEHSLIIDDFDKICQEDDSIFNIIIKKINLAIDYICDIESLSISSLSDIEDFIENNKFIEDYISSLLEIYAEMYNLNFRRLEINSYNQEINNRSNYTLNVNNNYLYEDEVSNARDFFLTFDSDTFYNIKNISEIAIKNLSSNTFNTDLRQYRLFEDNFFNIKTDNLDSQNTTMFFNKQLNMANLSDKLQSFTLDLLNGFFIKQKEFYENNLGLEIDLFELNEIIDNFQLNKSLYTNLSKKSFLINLVEKVNSEVYNKKSLYKSFIKGKDNNEIIDYYIDNADKFFINLKKDQNYLTNILRYNSQDDYKKSILSVVIPNDLVDKIDSSHGIKISLKYVPHKDLSENSDITLHGVYSEYEETFLPYFRNLNNLYYSRDNDKNYNDNYLSFYNEKDIFNKRYSILNSDSIENENLKIIANNHHESSRYQNIYNTFYNNNLNNNVFSSIDFYNNRIIDIDLYNFIINLRDRDFNLISRISKELFQENVNVINEKYVEIPSMKFCIDNNIFIYDVLFEINKNISILEYEKSFVEKQIFDIYFIPLSESLSIDGKTYYSQYTIDSNIIL